MKLTLQVRQAIYIGSICSLAYLAVYVARNVLSSVSPQMIEQGILTEGQIGSLSSFYFVSYAIGQLINGIIGDKIKSKYMLSIGLILAGICNALFSVLAADPMLSTATYVVSGFALAMIYAPMTKVVAENTEPQYTPRCSLGYTLASFLGSPLAGILAVWLMWQGVFSVSSALLIVMGVLCFVGFTAMERRGMITYGQYDQSEQAGRSVHALLQAGIVRFTMISMLTGVVRTTVVFWLPTFIAQYLGFSSKDAALLYTVSSFAICAAAFIAIFVYEKLGCKMELSLILFFGGAAVSFLLVYLIHLPMLCITFMVLAIIGANCASTMLWSIYCPSLRDTGMVSGATGFLDFASYMAAAVSSALFSNAVEDIGWGPLILIWCGLMALGILASLPGRKRVEA